jgi:hypothetical protein
MLGKLKSQQRVISLSLMRLRAANPSLERRKVIILSLRSLKVILQSLRRPIEIRLSLGRLKAVNLLPRRAELKVVHLSLAHLSLGRLARKLKRKDHLP